MMDYNLLEKNSQSLKFLYSLKHMLESTPDKDLEIKFTVNDTRMPKSLFLKLTYGDPRYPEIREKLRQDMLLSIQTQIAKSEKEIRNEFDRSREGDNRDGDY